MALQQSLINLAATVQQRIDDTAGKIVDHTGRVFESNQKLTEHENLRNVVGDSTRPGCINRGVVQGIVYATGGAPGVGSAADFPRVDLGSTDGVYVHFKLPLNIYVNNRMFWLRIRGYNYGGAKAVDETIVGYCKASTTRIEGIATKGNFSPAVYVNDNNDVMVRLYFPYIYYTTMVVDSMWVSTGAEAGMFKRGDIKPWMSLSSTLVF